MVFGASRRRNFLWIRKWPSFDLWIKRFCLISKGYKKNHVFMFTKKIRSWLASKFTLFPSTNWFFSRFPPRKKKKKSKGYLHQNQKSKVIHLYIYIFFKPEKLLNIYLKAYGLNLKNLHLKKVPKESLLLRR